MTQVAAIPHNMRQWEAAVAVVSGTQLCTHPIAWLCLAWLCLTMILPQNPVFSTVPGKAPLWWQLPPAEWISWDITLNFLTERRQQRSRPRGRGQKKSVLPNHSWPSDLHHQTCQHCNTTLIFQLRTLSRESLVSGWVNPYLFYE